MSRKIPHRRRSWYDKVILIVSISQNRNSLECSCSLVIRRPLIYGGRCLRQPMTSTGPNGYVCFAKIMYLLPSCDDSLTKARLYRETSSISSTWHGHHNGLNNLVVALEMDHVQKPVKLQWQIVIARICIPVT